MTNKYSCTCRARIYASLATANADRIEAQEYKGKALIYAIAADTFNRADFDLSMFETLERAIKEAVNTEEIERLAYLNGVITACSEILY